MAGYLTIFGRGRGKYETYEMAQGCQGTAGVVPSEHGRQCLSTVCELMGVMAKDTVRIGSIVMNCNDFARMMAFWREALGYAIVRPPTPGDPFVILKDPQGKCPNVSIDQGEPERGQLHLDLYTEDQAGEVERLLRLGASRYRPREPGEDFVVLADPEGNLFCVVDTKGH